jgi:hypothetical protein
LLTENGEKVLTEKLIFLIFNIIICRFSAQNKHFDILKWRISRLGFSRTLFATLPWFVMKMKAYQHMEYGPGG